MWEKEVSPRLRQRLGHEIILSRTLKTFGHSEGAVDEMVSPLLSATNPTLAVYAKPDGIHLRITAKAKRREEAEKMIAQREEEIRSLFEESIWGCDDETLEAVLGALLSEKGLSLATMESCTGGLLANLITDVPGSSAYFKGGMVAYTDEAKISHGVLMRPRFLTALTPHSSPATAP
jgi:nicotinamide-nucleotide amidase